MVLKIVRRVWSATWNRRSSGVREEQRVSATIAEFSCLEMTTASRAIMRTSNPCLGVAGILKPPLQSYVCSTAHVLRRRDDVDDTGDGIRSPHDGSGPTDGFDPIDVFMRSRVFQKTPELSGW